jgi:predicted metal-dependent hydrolase
VEWDQPVQAAFDFRLKAEATRPESEPSSFRLQAEEPPVRLHEEERPGGLQAKEPPRGPQAEEHARQLQTREHSDVVEFVRVRTARRYILRVRPDGSLRVTIPRGGSRAEAVAFVGRHLEWVARERNRVRTERAPVCWTHGSTILLAGESHTVEVDRIGESLIARYADRAVRVENVLNVRPEIERDLRVLAADRLVPRLRQLAAELGFQIGRVTIRNQRSRWGSCSRSGAIALNFRLVQMPPAISDYVLIHELMHLKEQNHGPRFWALVERACPEYRDAERWLRRSGRALF